MEFLEQHLSELSFRLAQHIVLSLSATIIAVVVGIPLGIIIKQKPRFRTSVLGVTNIFQTIPSLALLAFLIPFIGIGVKPTLVTLTVYALLPITRNTLTGLLSVPKASLEAANGLGFSGSQRLFKIEIPLALPIIIAGVRTATAMTIGITTIAAFIGAGGLGVFITEGLSLDNSKLILLGAIPTAILALILDYFISYLEIAANPRKRKALRYKKAKYTVLTVLGLFLIALISQALITNHQQNKKETIVVASKNFSEQYILANMMADIIHNKTGLAVKLKLNLGASMFLQSAMINGNIDIYPEYTGTAYLNILKQKKLLTAEQTYQFVKKTYLKRYKIIWLRPFGFNNVQTVAVSTSLAKKYHLRTLSDLSKISKSLTLATPPEFIKITDGYPYLKKQYDLSFKSIKAMQPDLMYSAIKNKQVEAIIAFTTDPRIQHFNLVPLVDNKKIMPSYNAAPIIRASIIKKYPQIKQALLLLAGKIDDNTMRQLNYQVNILHKPPKEVALNFLKTKKLIN